MERREEVQTLSINLARENNFTGLAIISPRVGKSKIVIDALEPYWGTWSMHLTTPRESVNESWGKEFVKWDREPLGVSCFASLKHIAEDLDCLIVDEPQMLSLAQIKMIKKKNPKRLWMLTGTADQYTRSILKHHLDINVYQEYTIGEAILDGIIANFHVYIVRVPLDDKRKNVEAGPRGNKFWVTEANAYKYLDTMFEGIKQAEKIDPTLGGAKTNAARRRAEMLYNGRRKMEVARWIVEHSAERILVFTTRTAIADMLSPYTYHTRTKRNDNLNKFIAGEIDELAVVQMSDMGITFPNLKLEVVHQLQTNSEQAIQKFLRTANLEDEKEARIIVTVYKDTVDEGWARQAIEGIPEDKVTWLEIEELQALMSRPRAKEE